VRITERTGFSKKKATGKKPKTVSRKARHFTQKTCLQPYAGGATLKSKWGDKFLFWGRGEKFPRSILMGRDSGADGHIGERNGKQKKKGGMGGGDGLVFMEGGKLQWRGVEGGVKGLKKIHRNREYAKE